MPTGRLQDEDMRQALRVFGYKRGKRYFIAVQTWGRKDHDENPVVQFIVGHYPDPLWHDGIASSAMRFKTCYAVKEVSDYLHDTFASAEQQHDRNPE